MKRGDYFVTSGEVLISDYAVEGTGNQRTIAAEVEWTFPLDFVEVVWGDGQKTDRQIISTTDLPAFGKKRFQIPFNAAGKKWVRFAAWDVAEQRRVRPAGQADAGDDDDRRRAERVSAFSDVVGHDASVVRDLEMPHEDRR